MDVVCVYRNIIGVSIYVLCMYYVGCRGGEPSYVNMEGKVVLPSGIAAIRQHVREVDNIPLQVRWISQERKKERNFLICDI